MKIGFFTMPVHRLDRNYTECLQEDREAIILADRLGYSEAYVGEHLTDAAESITNSMLFQASLISETTQIKLGTGTTNLSHTHPVLAAAQAAMMDFGELFVVPVCMEHRVGSEELAANGGEDSAAGNHEVRCVLGDARWATRRPRRGRRDDAEEASEEDED